MRLREARTAKGFSQEHMSRAADISLKHYQNIEYAISMPAVNIALILCEELEVDPREIDEWRTPRNRSNLPGPKVR